MAGEQLNFEGWLSPPSSHESSRPSALKGLDPNKRACFLSPLQLLIYRYLGRCHPTSMPLYRLRAWLNRVEPDAHHSDASVHKELQAMIEKGYAIQVPKNAEDALGKEIVYTVK